MSDDGFDAYDLSEFTEEDFAAIDADLARARGDPAIQIALENSPFNKFLSWKKHLAVTDLTSPLWYHPPFPLFACAHPTTGAKFSTSIVSMDNATNPYIYAPPHSLQRAENKYAYINPWLRQTTADLNVARYAHLIRTNPRTSLPPIQSVHKALEDQIHPEKRVVQITSDEERFGLRSVVWHSVHILQVQIITPLAS